MKKFIQILKGIWTFLNSRVFLYGLIALGVLFIVRTCGKLEKSERQNEIDQQNIIALNDTIKQEKTKSGQLQVSIASYISDIKGLKDLNKDLYDEVKDQKGKVLSLTKIVFQLRQDTNELREHISYLESIMSQPIQINDSTFSMDWTLTYNWTKVDFDVFKGRTYVGLTIKPGFTWRDAVEPKNRFGVFVLDTLTRLTVNPWKGNDIIGVKHYKTEMIERLSQMDLIIGHKVENKQLRVYAKTDYPGFTAASLAGVLIDPLTDPEMRKLFDKPKLFPNTWSLGVGASAGYNIFTGKPFLGPSVSITYDIYTW